MTIWLQFLALTAVIVVAGSYLSRYGDVIAEKTGLGRTWIGIILMASITSLPELITGISSVSFYSVPDIAVGDVLGSCMFNMLILALLDVKSGATPISARAHQGQVLAAAFGIFLLGLVTLSIFAGDKMPAIGWVGAQSLVFMAVYLADMRLVFQYERKRILEYVQEAAGAAQYGEVSSTRAYAIFGMNAVLIVAAATYLPHVGEQIARSSGLGQTFVGNILIAASTSLPEIVVSFGALRIGAVDMAYGNLFGSNLFDIAILAIDDFFYTAGPLIAHVSPSHALRDRKSVV